MHAGEESADRGLLGRASFSYAAKDQPAFEFGIDRRDDEALLEEEFSSLRSTRLDLFLSIDMAPFLNAELGIAPARATIEYRRQIRSDHIGDGAADPALTEALLASFAAAL